MHRLGVIALVVATLVASGAHAKGKSETPRRGHFSDGHISFDHLDALKVDATTDVIAEHALNLSGAPDAITVSLIYGDRPTKGLADLDNTFDVWHGARVKNRVAWGMRSDGGPSRESVHVGDRKGLRQRNRIGGQLLASEQTMTCVVVSGAVACVVTSAPIGKRDVADGIAHKILASIEIRK